MEKKSPNRYMLLYESTSTDEEEAPEVQKVEVSMGCQPSWLFSEERKVAAIPEEGSHHEPEGKYEDYVRRSGEEGCRASFKGIVRRVDNEDEEDEEEEEGSHFSFYRMIPPMILPSVDVAPFFRPEDIAKVLPGRSLQITDKGLYSITKPVDVAWTNSFLQRIFADRFPNVSMREYNVVDGTAGIGGNTIAFASLFREVHAVEYNDVHYEVMRNNTKIALDLQNVKTYHENVLHWVDQSHVDTTKTVFFVDPPWGGRKYKLFKYFTLRLGRMYIQDFIQKLYHRGYPMVVLKAPLNLNVNVILHEVGYRHVSIEKGQHMMLLIFS